MQASIHEFTQNQLTNGIPKIGLHSQQLRHEHSLSGTTNTVMQVQMILPVRELDQILKYV